MYCVKDSVIFERLAGNQPLKDVTMVHLQEFANIGRHHLLLFFAMLVIKTSR